MKKEDCLLHETIGAYGRARLRELIVSYFIDYHCVQLKKQRHVQR